MPPVGFPPVSSCIRYPSPPSLRLDFCGIEQPLPSCFAFQPVRVRALANLDPVCPCRFQAGCAFQDGLVQTSACQICSSQPGLPEHGFIQVGLAQDRLLEVGSPQRGFALQLHFLTSKKAAH